jgi:hypothetical protein
LNKLRTGKPKPADPSNKGRKMNYRDDSTLVIKIPNQHKAYVKYQAKLNHTTMSGFVRYLIATHYTEKPDKTVDIPQIYTTPTLDEFLVYESTEGES